MNWITFLLQLFIIKKWSIFHSFISGSLWFIIAYESVKKFQLLFKVSYWSYIFLLHFRMKERLIISYEEQNLYQYSLLNFICLQFLSTLMGLVMGLDISYKYPRVAIWPFLKLFARNKMVWPFGHFLAFLNVDKNSIF